jgi:DNA-binding CsgD family transcriptional regulator
VLQADPAAINPEALRAAGLTERESEVLQWIAQGKTNSEVASILGSSPRTVQKHVERVFQKLGAETRVAAVARAREL